jgi:NAD(P)H-hydrate repair Nnr-like enzyme with NAD(P)H-hydrate dehydratase domain
MACGGQIILLTGAILAILALNAGIICAAPAGVWRYDNRPSASRVV